MAIDEAISEAVREKLSPPTLRLYQWVKPSITIGYFQKASDINLEYCKKKSYPIIRRLTGGMAILHDSELTYSFSSRNDTEPFRNSLIENYLSLSSALASALTLINIDAQITLIKNRRERNPFCFKISSYGEITVNGKKIIGSAQKRYKNGFLQQGSIMVDFDAEELESILSNYNPPIPPLVKNPPSPILSKEGMGGFLDEIGTIKKYAPAVSIKELRKALKKAFEKTFNIRFISGGPTEFELNLAEQLKNEKYSAKKWNFCR
ncbi:MAG: biotin/lipoate A/B protein ligase family protein [Thermodesulfovibrionia bacterium]|nr:biotin/lipoate A/B protein ligase family protein [Thermodesulfovibrionia bacterium]